MQQLSENYTLINRIKKAGIYIVLILISLLVLLPLVFLLLNSFKSQAEIIRNPLSLPGHVTFEYIKNAFETIHFGRALGYTLVLEIFSLIGIVLFSTLCAWMITRCKSKAMNVIYLLFVAAMLVPFQAIMYPLISIMESLSLKNLLGLIIMYTGFGISMSVFMMTGYIKGIPRDIEESALIDGANIFQIFFRILLPLVKPMIITIVILNGMWIWNDYLLPFLTLGNSDFKTITLEI